MGALPANPRGLLRGSLRATNAERVLKSSRAHNTFLVLVLGLGSVPQLALQYGETKGYVPTGNF